MFLALVPSQVAVNVRLMEFRVRNANKHKTLFLTNKLKNAIVLKDFIYLEALAFCALITSQPARSVVSMESSALAAKETILLSMKLQRNAIAKKDFI